MRRIFVCSPFRGDVAANVARAMRTCSEVARAGDSPFAPHLFFPSFLDDSNPRDRELGVRCGLAWLATADELLVVGSPTEGMLREIEAARVIGLPIRRGQP